MKALVVHEFGGPEVLTYEDVDDPQPAAGEVLVRVESVGVNPVDTYIRSGLYPHLPPLPYVPGGDAAGTVAAVGADVTALALGDRVYIGGTVGGSMSGGCAEHLVRPADEVFPLPEAASYDQGAALGVPYATAHHGLFGRGRARSGETVFIHGASGAVGTAAIQLARAAGLTVIGTAGTDTGRELVVEQGASHALDHTSEDYLGTLADLTAGNGPELILEMLANVNLARDLEAVGRHGRIVIIGNRGEIQINPRVMMMKNADVLGLALWNCTREEFLAIHADLIAGLEDGSLEPVINRAYPLSEAAEAHRAVLEPGAHGKIVLHPRVQEQ